jgi:putative chitinase
LAGGIFMNLASRIDVSILTAIAPRMSGEVAARQKKIILAFGDMLPQILECTEVTTAVRIQNFLPQVAHESDGFCTLEEYASGQAYEGRKNLGNLKAGDGKRFKGRGPIQLTGRANYRAFTIWMRQRISSCPDFEVDPELVATWPWAGWALAFFWSTKKINAAADRDDLVAVTRIINGGTNGLADRRAYLAKTKVALAGLQGVMVSQQQSFAVLNRGMQGPPIEELQRALAKAGYYLMTIDGDFGAGTEAAVRAFQRARRLTIDGIVGGKTAAALKAYET